MSADREVQTPAPQQARRVLGRSDYARPQDEALGRKLQQLDALLTLVCKHVDAPDTESEPQLDFQYFNDRIQAAVLGLASDLATEAHELHASLQRDEADTLRLVQGQGAQA